MIRVTEHRRRKPGAECVRCKMSIESGERYRQLIAVNDDILEESFARRTAHSSCVAGDELWETFSEGYSRSPDARYAAAVRASAVFNERHPIGTPVRYWPGAHGGMSEVPTGETRTKARILGNTAVVWVTGHSACIALTHVEATR